MRFTFLLIALFVCLAPYGQVSTKTLHNVGTDSVVVSNKIFNYLKQLQQTVKLQGYELLVLQHLGRIDSARYNNDSLVVSFIGKNGLKLKTIKQTFLTRNKISNFEDSVVSYYNENGRLVYMEWWNKVYDKARKEIIERQKITYSRYEYDSKNRLVRRLKLMPEYRVWESTFSYEENKNVKEDGKWIDPASFWAPVEEALK
ncbi:hypothetical protein [Niabella drilacis]|uniref:Uncharacterized protein n=1 Tax=Niabella drilacis (strain DSM 25811 / CCM 8410 / CCUG 62505 / LMG 26954 / E90) TaxID=1285928 RepID=A0A1G6V1G1_NIADE|nr:hypothetical protein [Niabella drilacis]SDD47333.1 hypothetical protein SAMN04487894_109158 [Niabella drilacis]